MSQANRAYLAELHKLVNKKVEVRTTEQKTYYGVLKGINEELNLVMTDVKVSDGEKFFSLLISGKMVSYISLGDIPFDINGLAEELAKVFKSENVKVFEDTNNIRVMDRFVVNEQGVSGGEGIVADRIKSIWEAYKTHK